MSPARSIAVGTSVAAVLLTVPLRALGQPVEPAPPPPSSSEEEDTRLDPEKGLPRPPPTDQRAGHPVLAGRIGWAAPAGSFAVDTPVGRVFDTGPTYGGTLGIGVSRYVVVELSAEYGLPNPSSRCRDCSGRFFDGGLALTYHLAQGVAVDPWISYGLGYRWTKVVSDRAVIGQLGTDIYHGVDVARIGLGADYYPLPQVGLGPLLEGDFGTFFRHPTGLVPSVYAFFQVGVRLAFDPFRRSFAPAPHRTASAREP